LSYSSLGKNARESMNRAGENMVDLTPPPGRIKGSNGFRIRSRLQLDNIPGNVGRLRPIACAKKHP